MRLATVIHVTTILTSADADYTAELAGFNTAYPQNPDAVVAASSPADVVEAIAYAREHGLTVRALSTGHGTHAPLMGGLVINVSRLADVVIDPEARTATIGGGARWAAVVEAAAAHGLAPITGSSPNVGVAGYITGGGLGPLARSHGFSSDWAREFTVATASGEVVTANANENPDLFWALRGGKGGFGVVLSTTIELVELATLYGGALIFDEPHLETVVRGWATYTADAPADVTTSVVVIAFPPLDVVPEPFRGRRLTMVRFAFPGDSATGESLAAPLRALAPVYIDTVREMPYTEIGTVHSDPVDPGPGWGTGGLITSVDGGFVDALLPFIGSGAQVPFMAVELRHIGGATRHDVPEGSSVGGRNSDYTFHVIGAPDPSLFAEVLPRVADGFLAAIGPWVAEESTANFANSRTADRAWSPESAKRLARIRSEIDPTGLFPLSL